MATHIQEAIVRMLATAREPLTTDPQVVGSMLLGVITGVSRRMLESGAPEKQLDPLGRELIIAARAYLDLVLRPSRLSVLSAGPKKSCPVKCWTQKDCEAPPVLSAC